MLVILRAALVAVALSVVLAAPASAVTLKGQVIGSPYVADAARTAVPVLFSKESARAAKLRSPLGLVVVPRRTAIAAPGGKVQPGRLRLGDRFSGSAKVGKEARSAAYPHVTLARIAVTKRSKQLSTTELEELIRETRREVARLNTNVASLGTLVTTIVKQLDARVTALAGAVTSLGSDLDAVKGTVGSLSATLATTAATLRDRIDLVRSDLQPQVTAALDAVTSLTATVGSCAASASVIGRVCLLESLLGGLNLLDVQDLNDRVTQVSSALTTTVNGLTGLALTGDLPATLTAPITGALGQLAGLQGVVTGLSGDVTGLTGTVGGLQGTVGGLVSNVGAVDIGALSSTLGNLIGALGADPSGLNPAAIANLEALLATAGSQITTLQSLVGGVDVGALSTTVGGLTGSVGTINTTLAGVCAAVNGQSIPVLGTLPLVGSVTGLLTATLTDACA